MKAQDDKVIAPGVFISDPLFAVMRDLAPQISERFKTSPLAAALHAAAFSNNSTNLIYDRISSASAQIPVTIQNAIESQAALENTVRMRLTSPSMFPESAWTK